MKVLPVVVVVVLACVVQVASDPNPPPPPPPDLDPPQCGVEVDGALCKNNLCCSKWGHCGTSDVYCGDGCQSGPCTTLPPPPPPSPPPPPPPSPPPPPQQCGAGADGALCRDNLCCSAWGFCGATDAYCGNGCQSGPCETPPPPSTPPAPGGLGEILSESSFDSFFPNRNKSFYNYESFIEAAKSFPEFAATGDKVQRKQEIAAFCAHVCQQTSCMFQNQFDSL